MIDEPEDNATDYGELDYDDGNYGTLRVDFQRKLYGWAHGSAYFDLPKEEMTEAEIDAFIDEQISDMDPNNIEWESNLRLKDLMLDDEFEVVDCEIEG